MVRLYSLGLLLPLSLTAQAQQSDTLVSSSAPDSLHHIRAEVILIQDPSIITEKLQQNSPSFLTIQPLLSRVAGVQATPYSGAPGAGAVVRIRGAASIDSHVQPLYVVDGVPVFQYRFATVAPAEVDAFQNGGFDPDAGSNPLLSLPPEDIEMIEVLKGAYDTGQYGFLGQNGVIRITTKRGLNNKPLRIRYTGYGGVQQARSRYQLLGARELGALYNEANQNNKYAPEYSAEQLAALGQGTDWQEELIRTAAVHEHHLSADGGTRFGTRYYVAANYLQQTGILLNSGLQRYNLRLNLQQQLGRRVQLSGNLNLSETQVRKPPTQPYQQILRRALTYLPNVPVYEANGDYATDLGNANPVQLAEQNYSTPRNRRLLGQAQASYQLLTGLTLNLRGALERDVLLARDYQSPAKGNTRTAGLEMQERGATYQQVFVNPALQLERTFGSRHAVEATAEASYWRRKQAQYITSFSRNDQPPYQQVGNISYSEYASEQGYQAYAMRGSYTYNGRYAVAGSWQRNSSGQLPTSHAHQWLPAAQVTWHAGEETWLKNRNAVSRLNVWAGVGKTSNRGNFAGNHGYRFTAANSSFFYFLDELTTQHEAGLALGLWQNRLELNASVYRRETHIELGPLGNSMPSYLRNRGLELTLASPWQTGKVSGNTTLAAAFNQNRYGKPEGSLMLDLRPSPGHFVLRADEPLSSFIGEKYLGPDANGNPQFQLLPGSNVPGQELLGSGLPRQLATLTQTVRYGHLEVQLKLDGMFGYQVFDTNIGLLDIPTGYFNATTRVRDRWTPANTDTQVPRAGTYSGTMNGLTNYSLQSGNHVRLSSATLTANVWQHEKRSAAVFLSGTNLFVLSSYRGFDPNVSAAEADPKQAGLDRGYYPTARTILLGLRASL